MFSGDELRRRQQEIDAFWKDTQDRSRDRALQREPTLYPSWYLAAAAFHLQTTGDRTAARRYLEACLKNAPGSAPAKQAAELLRSIR